MKKAVTFAGRIFAAPLVAAALAGCAAPVISDQEKQITKIVVLPVVSPYGRSAQVRGITSNVAYADWTQAADNRARSESFTSAFDKDRKTLGDKMTTALVSELRKAGYQPSVFQGARPTGDDAEDVDYAKLATEDPVLHLWFDAAEMYSPAQTVDFMPRLNAGVRVLRPQRPKAYLLNEAFYYGADSRGEKYWSAPSDAKYRYKSFDTLFASEPQAAESMDAGVQAIAVLVAKELKQRYPVTAAK